MRVRFWRMVSVSGSCASGLASAYSFVERSSLRSRYMGAYRYLPDGTEVTRADGTVVIWGSDKKKAKKSA